MAYLLLFLSGALLCNAIPHLAAGLRGEPFPTPFAKPRGVGLSSPLTNFLWGFANLCLGTGLAMRWLGSASGDWGWVAMAAGALAIGLHLSLHFGKVRRDREG